MENGNDKYIFRLITGICNNFPVDENSEIVSILLTNGISFSENAIIDDNAGYGHLLTVDAMITLMEHDLLILYDVSKLMIAPLLNPYWPNHENSVDMPLNNKTVEYFLKLVKFYLEQGGDPNFNLNQMGYHNHTRNSIGQIMLEEDDLIYSLMPKLLSWYNTSINIDCKPIPIARKYQPVLEDILIQMIKAGGYYNFWIPFSKDTIDMVGNINSAVVKLTNIFHFDHTISV